LLLFTIVFRSTLAIRRLLDLVFMSRDFIFDRRTLLSLRLMVQRGLVDDDILIADVIGFEEL